MNKELQEKLYEKYPSLFGQKDLPMTQTAMCWGIDTGDGWYNIMDSLCLCINAHIKNLEHQKKYSSGVETPEAENTEDGLSEISFVQVKEKFGRLRVYTTYSDDTIEGMVDMASELSGRTCENCGNPGEIARYSGWYRPLCPKCAEDHVKKSGHKIDAPDEDE